MKILQIQGQEKEPVFINAKVMNEKFLRSKNQSFVGHAFQTYCRETSLHGWKYVSDATTSKFERLCWLLLAIGSLFAASTLVYR